MSRFQNTLRAIPYGFALLAAIAYASCMPELPSDDVVAFESADAGTQARRLTIATYNVADFDADGTAPPQHSAVARFAATEGIDVLILEEIQSAASDDDVTAFTRALEVVSHPMPHRAVTAMSDGFNAIGVWSRFPLIDVDEILEENTRTVLRFGVDAGGTPLRFFGCHLKSGDDPASRSARLREAARLEAYLTAHHDPAREPVIVLGDMNTMSDSDWADQGTLSRLRLTSDNPKNSANDLTAVNLEALPEGWTYPAMESLLDHILLSPAAMSRYRPESVRLAAPLGDGVPSPSDHLPVMLDF